MSDPTDSLKQRLYSLRQTARYLLEQADAYGGEVLLPPERRRSLDETRAGLAACVAGLRRLGVPVDDAPEDRPPQTQARPNTAGPTAGQSQSGGNNFGVGAEIGQIGVVVAGDYIVNQGAQPPAAPADLERALALLAGMPTGPGAPLPSPDSFAASDVARLMPLVRNELFVGREEALREAAALLRDGAGVVITTGMGGVSKTMLAVELAYRYGRFFAGGVFWLDASAPERLEDSIAASGHPLLRDPAFGTRPRADQIALVKARWAEPLPRLLVFDNCEDPALLAAHRPPPGGCRVLATSRNPRWPAGQSLAVRPLDVLARPASVALLRRLAPHLSETQAKAIAEELGDLPLALHLAGSFLALSPTLDPATFRQRLRERSAGHPALDGDGVAAPTYQQQRAARLEAVFEISLNELDQRTPTDALPCTLLARAAGLQPPGWPFPRRFLVETAPPAEATDPDAPPAEAAVERLLQLGLLEAEEDGRLRLHRLLAAFVWSRLDGPAAFDAFAPAALRWVVELIKHAADLWPARDVQGRDLLDQERPLWEQFLDWGYTHEHGSGRCASARATARLGNY